MNKDITLEDLGYEKEKDYSDRFNCLCYQKMLDRGYERIIFYLNKKKIKTDFMTFKYVCDPKYLSLEELRAIYNKCKKLGWLDE